MRKLLRYAASHMLICKLLKSNYLREHIYHLFPLLQYFACTLRPYLRLGRYTAASFDNMSTAATVAVAKFDLQYGVAHTSHVVLVVIFTLAGLNY